MRQIPRMHTVRTEIGYGEELWITPLSDLHIEASTFDKKAFNSMMRERAKHPNHRVIIIGDVLDLVVPVDLRRWRASVPDAELAGRDDWLNAGLDMAVERLKDTGCVFDLVCPGNHEDEFQKRHGFDTTSALARELRCARGGYSGMVQYGITMRGADKCRLPMFRIAYHHGAWGGRVQKGFGGARDWFRGIDGWHIACYGHNHQTTIHREAKRRPTTSGKLEEYPCYYVNTGSWSHTYTDDAGITTYAERAGFLPTSRQTPLIKVKCVGKHQLVYTVEV